MQGALELKVVLEPLNDKHNVGDIPGKRQIMHPYIIMNWDK